MKTFFGMTLVTDLHNAWRFWSIRINAIIALVVAYVMAFPDVLVQTMSTMPPELRSFISPFVGMVLFVFVTLVRLVKQEKLSVPAAAPITGAAGPAVVPIIVVTPTPGI